MSRFPLMVGVLLLEAGCWAPVAEWNHDGGGVTDSGPDAIGDGVDGNGFDAGAIDGGLIDSGLIDSGTIDSGADAGTTDGAATDGGDTDAGPDAGPPDAGRTIQVVQATYGSNCGVAAGNATTRIDASCTGKETCEYRVDIGLLGDPAPGCMKDYVVQYQCAPDGETREARVPAEATGKLVFLECASPSGPGIRVESASYGNNCLVAPVGNATWSVALSCNGHMQCPYTVTLAVLGDPAFGCAKAFAASWNCGPATLSKQVSLSAEAAGRTAVLTCP